MEKKVIDLSEGIWAEVSEDGQVAICQANWRNTGCIKVFTNTEALIHLVEEIKKENK